MRVAKSLVHDKVRDVTVVPKLGHGQRISASSYASSFAPSIVCIELFECRLSAQRSSIISSPAYMTDAHTEVWRVQDRLSDITGPYCGRGPYAESSGSRDTRLFVLDFGSKATGRVA